MENPYYEIVALIKSLARVGTDGFFTADIGLDDKQLPVVLLDGVPIGEPCFAPDELEITPEDDGRAVLCAPCDRGFIVLAKLWQL